MSDESVPRGGLHWPMALATGLLVVVAVNFTMMWIAISGADTVVESYDIGRR